jgi:hypothetical protein
MTDITTQVTTHRHARIDLPYDKVMAALRKIAEEEGHHLGGLNWTIGVPDAAMAFFHIKDLERCRALCERVWLCLHEDSAVVETVEKVT